MDHVKQLEALCQRLVALAGELGEGWVQTLLCSKLPAMHNLACADCWPNHLRIFNSAAFTALLTDMLTLFEVCPIIPLPSSPDCRAPDGPIEVGMQLQLWKLPAEGGQLRHECML